MSYILAIVAIFIAYLFGSIPVGYLVARMYGVDVTASGSGRIGGTNVLRSVGPMAAALTVLGDILKGLIPVYLLAIVAHPMITALAAAATVLGHNYSIFLRFRGGVGAGTAMGALGGLTFPGALVVTVFGLVALGVSRYASVLSATIAVTSLVILSIFAVLGYVPYVYIVFGVLNLLVIFNALRPNFARLRAGTERKVGQKPENIVRVSPQ
ncbi:MAG: glycerol-3-phosphate acyltransferase [Chloroflexi bacterium]|nr:glycerol-3-phosphate acyltransferase [Chloroflexota bacterium]